MAVVMEGLEVVEVTTEKIHTQQHHMNLFIHPEVILVAVEAVVVLAKVHMLERVVLVQSD
jgi:hypothetical protein